MKYNPVFSGSIDSYMINKVAEEEIVTKHRLAVNKRKTSVKKVERQASNKIHYNHELYPELVNWQQ